MDVGRNSESIADLVADCAQFPDSVRHSVVAEAVADEAYPSWSLPTQWLIDDSCVAQVAGIDDYGCRPRG